ncbi:MAG: hypothetical protein ACODAU_02680 [Myxococcota bacterium]
MAKNVKTVLIPIVVVLVAAGIAYGAGRWQGSQQTEQVRSELNETKQDLEARLTRAQTSLTQCRAQADQLEARRRIHMAMEELAALNFGYAQKHLASAGNVLAETAAEGSELAELAKEVEETEIQATGQLEQQRAHLRRLVTRFDEIVPPADP